MFDPSFFAQTHLVCPFPHHPPRVEIMANIDDSLIADDARIGSISLILRRCQITGMAEDQSNRGCVPDDSDPPNIRRLASRSDYLSHRAESLSLLKHSPTLVSVRSDCFGNRYQPPKSIPATLYHVQWLDSQNGPAYMEFKFIYRSREVLISKGILPTPSAPLPTLTESSTPAPPPPPPKKRKSRSENTTNSTITTKRKASAAKHSDVPPPSSPTTVEATPPKPARPAKKPRASTKSQIKKEIEVKNEIEVKDIHVLPDPTKQSPDATIGEIPSSDPPISPMIEVLPQQHQVISHPGHHVLHNTVLPWVESQSATIDIPVDILRELRELRVTPLPPSRLPKIFKVVRWD